MQELSIFEARKVGGATNCRCYDSNDMVIKMGLSGDDSMIECWWRYCHYNQNGYISYARYGYWKISCEGI